MEQGTRDIIDELLKIPGYTHPHSNVVRYKGKTYAINHTSAIKNWTTENWTVVRRTRRFVPQTPLASARDANDHSPAGIAAHFHKKIQAAS